MRTVPVREGVGEGGERSNHSSSRSTDTSASSCASAATSPYRHLSVGSSNLAMACIRVPSSHAAGIVYPLLAAVDSTAAAPLIPTHPSFSHFPPHCLFLPHLYYSYPPRYLFPLHCQRCRARLLCARSVFPLYAIGRPPTVPSYPYHPCRVRAQAPPASQSSPLPALLPVAPASLVSRPRLAPMLSSVPSSVPCYSLMSPPPPLCVISSLCRHSALSPPLAESLHLLCFRCCSPFRHLLHSTLP